MLILSTFNSEYLKSPLQDLIKEFTTESVEIKYVNTNIVGALIDLQSNLKPLPSLAVLLRLFDLTGKCEDQNIKEKLDENLRLVSAQINALKKEKELSLIVFLCPSPKNFYDQALFDIENDFLTVLKDNKIHTLTQSDIRKHYLLNKVDNSVEHETHIPYTPEFYAASAILLARRLQVLTRRPYKAIVVDCDNTLWTGVAGDVGTEKVVFADNNIALQEFLINQKESGIIICLCSKNEEQTVLDVFKERQEEMRLKIGDVAKYRINWGAKSINIASLASELNLSLDSFIFIDDSACEIAEVNRQLQGVLCVTMPQSLKEFNHTWVFDINEHLLLTETDRHRSELYKQAETRVAVAKKFRDPIEYLRLSELGQSIVISKIESENDVKTIQRVWKLAGKTNQFNLFPEAEKFSEREIKEMVTNDKKEVFIGRISDNFDKDDITATALCSIDENILKVDGFFVSCRKFDRGIEYELIKYMTQFAQAKRLTHIEIKFKKVINRMAWIFLNVLSEKKSLKNPILNFLFKKDSSLTQAAAQFLYKYLNISLNFDVLATDTIFNVALSVDKLRNLQIDSLIRATLNAKQVQAAQEVPLNGNDVVSERYLVQLRKMTSSLDYLMKKFFIDIRKFESIDKLEDRVIALCNHLLGEQGQDKSLVSRGLDSLKATQLCGYLYNSDQVNIDITKLLCAKMTVINLIKFIKTEKETLKNISETVLINDYSYNKNMQASSQQQKRLWMAEKKEGINNSSNYHMLACYTISNLDRDRFKVACQQLIERYDIFGATFFTDKGGQLVQSVFPPEERKLELVEKDLRKGESLRNAIENVIGEKLSMSHYPLIRFILFKDQTNKNYHILFHVHHGIFDAISLKNYLNKLSELYCNPLIPNQSELIGFPPQYISYIHYQQEKLLNNDYRKKALNFWKNELSKIETITEFPYDQANVTFKLATERKAERYNFSSTQDDLTALKYLAQSAGVTPYSVISTLFSLLIGAYAYQDNIAIITATNGRSGNPSFHKMIGFFVNLLVQCFDLEENKDKTFTEYLKDNHQKWLDAQAFQDIPFEEIQKILSEQDVKDILLNPALIYQSYDIPELRLDRKLATLTIPEQPIIFDLREFCRFGNFTLFVQEDNTKKQLNFVIEYAKDLYSANFIERIANNFKSLIATVVNNPEQRLDEISVICKQEHEELLRAGQGPEPKYTVDNLVQGFQRSVKKYPENIAICHNKHTFSYTKLDKVSDKLACFLYEQGIRKGDNVGIACPRNHLFFIVELAILKRGAVFVPLSMQDPENRLLYIIKDASIKYIVGDVDLTQGERFKKDKSIDLNFIDIQAVMKQVMAIDFPVLNEQFLPEISREDRACVLYTSGSTGNPKGVILKHKGIFRVVESPSFVTVNSADKIAQMANEAFDAAQLECWLAWNNGASLVIIDKNTMLDPEIFREQLLAQKITIMWLTAALFHQYAYSQPTLFKQLIYLLVGGDAIDKQAVQNVLEVSGEEPLRIINGYGPTETSIFALTYPFNEKTLNQYSASPIGRPINNTTVQVLTQFGQLAPLGGLGELFIAGDGVAEAYLGLPDMTEKCFVSREKNSDTKTYKSGDLVKWTGNYSDKNIAHEIQFLGRINQEQIKINGVLVSLPGIEKVLAQHPTVKQVVVLHEVSTNQQKVLRAFYTKNEAAPAPSRQEWVDYLQDKLPATMRPTSYTEIDEFPVTRNGKLDRKKLLEYHPLEINPETYLTETLTDNEQKLLDIFKKVLSSNSLNLNDNFFNYGGTSIQAIQLIAEVKDIFDKNISFDNLRQNPSIKSLVHFLELENDALLKGSLLSVLKGEGDNRLPPVVFIHPAGGGLSCFEQLIKKLQFANVCFGIEDPLLQEGELKTLPMKEMAANYLERIKKEIEGPFILAGYSFGGMLALEMAAQLEQSGQKKSLLGVILLDTWVVSCIPDEGIKLRLKEQVLVYCDEQRKNAAKNQEPGEKLNNLMVSLKKICEHHQGIGFVFQPDKLVRTPVRLLKAEGVDKIFSEMGAKEKNNYLLGFVNEELFVKQAIKATTHFDLLENLNLPEVFSEQVSELCQRNKSCSQKVIPIDLSQAEKYSASVRAPFFNNTKVNNEVCQSDNEKSMLRRAK